MTELFQDRPHLEVNLFDALHRGNPQDTAFYRRVCRNAQGVLELGCGSGRILRSLRTSEGRRVGVDLDRPRLARAQSLDESSICSWIRASMPCLPFRKHSFSHVLIPFNALFCLLTIQDLTRCLREVHRLLTPNGSLYFDVYQAETASSSEAPVEDDAEDENGFFWIEQIEVQGVLFDVFERDQPHSRHGRIDVVYRFVPQGAEENLPATSEIEIAHCFRAKEEIDIHLRDTGFDVLECWGGFLGQTWSEHSEMMVYKASPATP